ncbi:MAG TPA: DNA primase [Jiangellales bacterium]|nr:DNA primase [Jiangellales bacterium]
MAGRIRDEDIAAVRERARIDEIVREYVTLRNAGGGSLKGLCPFHDEKSPSFHVTPARGLYHCFGCQVGGDVISFVQNMEQIGFAEAVERLADKVGIALRYDDTGPAGGRPGRNREQRTRLVEAHAAAAEMYAATLVDSPDAVLGRQFLADRGFDQEAAGRFGVGYAPRDGDALRQHLRGRGFTDEELLAAGLVAQGRGAPYDRFRGRLVWPIRDLLGDVVGFGARRLHDDDRVEAKYLNTPETPIYHKGHLLYGVDLAKRDIARRSQAVVVEGYTDVMACHLAGVTTAVATCGTAFGDEHAKVLRRLLLDQDEMRGEVIFTFDGDAAGQKAALRAFEGDQRFVSQTYIAIAPDGLDPCELRQRQGDAAVRELVARRQPLFRFAIRSMLAEHDLDGPEGRRAALDRTVPLVARIRDRAVRDDYARLLAGWTGAADELAVVRRVRQVAGTPERAGRRYQPPPDPGQQTLGVPVHGDVDPQTLAVEREALKAAIQRPAIAGPLFDDLDAEAFRSPAYRSVREVVAKAGGCATQPGGPGWVDALRQAAPDEVVRHLVTELAVEPVPADDDAMPRYVSSVVLRLHEMWVSRRLVGVKARLQRTDPEAETETYNRLFAELMALEKHRRDLRERGLGNL